MRILIASPTLSFEQGASQIAAMLAEHLGAKGHQVELWAPPPPGALVPALLLQTAQASALAAHVRRTGPFDLVDVQPVLVSPALRRLTLVLARTVQPDLLYLAEEGRSQPWPSTLGRLNASACRLAAASRVRLGLRRADQVLTLGRREKRWLESHMVRVRDRLDSYVVAPPPLDRDRLLAVRQRRQRRPNGSPHRFLWIGRWAAHKGPDTLLSWATRWLPLHPDDSLTVAGAGDQPESVRSMLSPVQTQVLWIPGYTRKDLPELLGRHDVGLFTSRVEGWGISLQEMLESGLPVCATDAGATDELAEYFTRQLRGFPPTQMDDDDLDDIARNGYLDRFNWTRIVLDYEQRVLSLLQRSHHGVGTAQ